MPNISVLTAAEGLPTLSRRKTLGLLTAASITPAVAAASPSESTSGINQMVIEPQENPNLLAAYDQLLAARAELSAAKAALQWLADEWRHLWPLAPEEILGCANADYRGGSGTRDTAERDIIGNYLKRDTSALTKRFSRKMRQETPVTCFSILTPEDAQRTIDIWTKRPPSGRTEKALERNGADRERIIREYRHKLALARDYQAETTRLREASGVEQAKQRVKDADRSIIRASDEISKVPAFTHEGLVIKAEAIKASGIFDAFDGDQHPNGIIVEMARFIETTVELGGRISA